MQQAVKSLKYENQVCVDWQSVCKANIESSGFLYHLFIVKESWRPCGHVYN